MLNPRTWLPLLLLSFATASLAQSDDHENRIDTLEEENRTLRERLDRLEGGEEERQAEIEAEIDDVAEEAGLGLNMVIGKDRNTRGTFQIYGDVGGLWSDPARSGRGDAFFFNGSVDIFFTARVGDHFHVLSETVFQTRVGSGSAGDGSKWDQERLWGAWAFSDSIQLKFGLEHSPISLWNRIFHHGHWLEMTILRPMLAQFESGSGILPMHEAGLEILGDIPLAAGSLQYIVFLSNGRGDAPNVVQEFSDRNSDKAIVFGAGYNFDAADTIFLGLFFRTDEIPPDADGSDPARAGSIREWIVSLQLLYQSDRFDIIAEFVYINNDDKTSNQTFESYTGYFQIGYHINDFWTPYARLDFREMDMGNPYFAPLGRDLDDMCMVLGVRWDFLDNAALKFEFAFGERQTRDSGGGIDDRGYIVFGIQLAFVF